METQWVEVFPDLEQSMSTFCIQIQLISTIMCINFCFILRSTGRWRMVTFELLLPFLEFASQMLGRRTSSTLETGTITSTLALMTLQTFCVMTVWTTSFQMWHTKTPHLRFLVCLMWQPVRFQKINNLPEVLTKVAEFCIATFKCVMRWQWAHSCTQNHLCLIKQAFMISSKCRQMKKGVIPWSCWHCTSNECTEKSVKKQLFNVCYVSLHYHCVIMVSVFSRTVQQLKMKWWDHIVNKVGIQAHKPNMSLDYMWLIQVTSFLFMQSSP